MALDFLPSRVSLCLALVLLFDGALNSAFADCDLTDDFFVSQGSSETPIHGKYFSYSALRGFRSPANAFASKKATAKEFPALSSQGVSVMLLEFQPQTVNPPHIHPRSTELLYLMDGVLDVAFVDTTEKLFQQRIQRGELFVFPQGLVHYQFNNETKRIAKAISSFGNSNPGTVALPITLFGTKVLEASFKVDEQTIAHLRSPYIRVITNQIEGGSDRIHVSGSSASSSLADFKGFNTVEKSSWIWDPVAYGTALRGVFSHDIVACFNVCHLHVCRSVWRYRIIPT